MKTQFTHGGWGLVPDEILAIYPKINVTGLKAFNTSPAYFESAYILKELESAKAMTLGTRLHYAILEPEKFEMMFVEEPDDSELPINVLHTLDDLKEWCLNEGLKVSGTKSDLVSRLRDHGSVFETYDEYIERYCSGREIMKKKEYRAAKRILERIKDIPSVDLLLKDGEAEKLGWVIHECGVIISFRVDYFKSLDKNIAGFKQFAIDLKTTNSLTTERDLQNFISKDDTHIQGAFYADALEFLTKLPTAFAVFAVETTPPYTTMMSILGGATMECGRADYTKNIYTFKECHAAGKYPTGFEKIGTIDFPPYKLSEIENREAKKLNEGI